VKIKDAKVAVLIPSGGAWEAGFGYDCCRCMAFTASLGIATSLYTVSGSMLAQNRSDLAEMGLKSGATHLMWFDDDMRFPKDTIIRLLEHDKDIVAANYAFRASPETPVSYDLEKGRVHTTDDSTGLEKVHSIGFGVTMIKPTVFQKLDKPWFANGYIQDTDSYFEEVQFLCMKLRDEGIELFIDHDISKEVRHIGQTEWMHTGEGHMRNDWPEDQGVK
jgi:hypothetical protein